MKYIIEGNEKTLKRETKADKIATKNSPLVKFNTQGCLVILIKRIIIQILIALVVAFVGWVSHFYRFPQHAVPILTL